MGLDIITSDKRKTFHSGYISFSLMRSYFVLPYGRVLYGVYAKIIKFQPVSNECYDDFLEKIGDLSILIDHSDCDGELSSDECKRLLPALTVDEDKISRLDHAEDRKKQIIERMYDFIDLVRYCSEHDDIKLLFT